MTGKEQTREVLDNLPEDATLNDILYALYVRARAEQGLQEIRDGKGIPHEEVKREFQKWLR